MSFVAWIIVGLIAGWATGKLMRGSGYGVIMDIVIGILGALIGGFIMRSLGFAGQGGMIYTILVAIGGAVLLTWIVRMITGNRGGKLPTDKDSNIRRAA
ncbi:MAG: GlsB/YeaQ/YmgE family stress response membrane protein [Acidobacteria bacterium]|nr:MAG: GlsB/YeaQ/YmgE family stress response membrane protein [Acidobacteriota bacterium]